MPTTDARALVLSNVQFRSDPVTTAQAEIGGFRLFYEFPKGPRIEECVDAFVVAATIPAMASGLPLEIQGNLPVSRRLLASLDTAQYVLHDWLPQLQRVPILATPRRNPRTTGSGVSSFFSGGVDSSYTFLEHQSVITDPVLIHGMADTTLGNPHFPEIERRMAETVAGFGKRLVVVRSNAREFIRNWGIGMSLYHGSMLASIALLLGSSRVYVPSSERYDNLYPWGSHPLLDPHWSTESCEIVHHGCELNRIDKLKRVAESPALLDALRVCNGDSPFNCGRCEKCLRSMVVLEILGARTKSLPPLSLDSLRHFSLSNARVAGYAQTNYEFAIACRRPDVAAALRTILRQWRIKDALKRLDGAALDGAIYRASLRLRGTPPKLPGVGFD